MALSFQSLGPVLVGPKGEPGEQGNKGQKGNQGVTGGQGTTGEIGEHGVTFIITTAKINEGAGVETSFLISTCNIVPVEGDFIISADNEAIGKVIEVIEVDNVPTNVTVEYVIKIQKPQTETLMIPEDHIFDISNYDSITYDSPEEQKDAVEAEWEENHSDEPTAFAWRNSGASGYSVDIYRNQQE
jgi:hypothetical protein